MKYVVTCLVLVGCASGIAAIFWQQELKYSLPTPIPAEYRAVALGQQVNLYGLLSSQKAYFLHFYNPDCPCSRFNSKHVQELIHEHQDSIEIVIVVPSQQYVAKAAREFGDDLTIIADGQEFIAKACGVYSTPQAVILDQNHRLYYRGNYNKARYCTSRATNFAELSLIAFLHKQPAPLFGIVATQAYGCSLEDGQQTKDLEFF